MRHHVPILFSFYQIWLNIENRILFVRSKRSDKWKKNWWTIAASYLLKMCIEYWCLWIRQLLKFQLKFDIFYSILFYEWKPDEIQVILFSCSGWHYHSEWLYQYRKHRIYICYHHCTNTLYISVHCSALNGIS